MSDKKEQEYLTEIPDLGEISKFIDDVEFSQEFWENVAKQINKENKEYVEQCKRLKIDPVSGKSTMSWEERNKMFTL